MYFFLYRDLSCSSPLPFMPPQPRVWRESINELYNQFIELRPIPIITADTKLLIMTTMATKGTTLITTTKLIHPYAIYQATGYTYLEEYSDHTDMMTTSTMLDTVLTSTTASIMIQLQVKTGDILTLTTGDIKDRKDHFGG